MRSAILGCTLLLAFSLAAQQQDNSQPAQQQTQSSDSSAQKSGQQQNQQGQSQQKKNQQQQNQQKKPGTAQNPFPETESEQAAHQAQQQDNGQQEPAAPQPAAGAQQKKPSTSDANPFPEAESEKAQHEAEQPAAPSSAPSSGSSAQPDRNYSSSQDQLKGLDLPGAGDTRTTDGAGGTILSPELGRKDTKVGEFYLHTGDFKGAYDRFAEAMKVDPGNAQAVFDLAEAARHLNHRDEAVRNYQLYLSALPDGPRAKDARKALKDLGAQPNS